MNITDFIPAGEPCPKCGGAVDLFPAQTFKCRSCDLSGDVFTWLMVKHGWSFRWAVQHVKQQAAS